MSAFASFNRIKVEHPKNWWPQLAGMTIFFCCTRHILICLSLQCTAVRWYFECHQLGLCTITNYYYLVKCKDNRATWQWAGAETDYRSFILILRHPVTAREAKKRGRGRRHNWSGETFVLMTIYLVTPKQRFEPLSFPLAWPCWTQTFYPLFVTKLNFEVISS